MKTRNAALAISGAVGAAVAVKMLKRAATVDWETVSQLVPHSERSRFVAVDGARVHYQEFGSSSDPVMILIHGYTASVYVWHTVAPMLAATGLRVIAVDLIGFGYSEKPGWFDYSIQSQSRMIERFMDRLGIGKATIVGSSYGGAVALDLTLAQGERVDKLVLVDAVCNDEPKRHPLLRLASLPYVGEAVTPWLVDSKRFLKLRMHNTLARTNHHMITKERVECVRRPLFAADAHRSVLATSRNWDANRLEQDAHLITNPTLIIWGEEDTVIPIKNGYKLHQEIPDSRFVVIRDCGHVPQEERSELFTKLVSEFCLDQASEAAANADD